MAGTGSEKGMIFLSGPRQSGKTTLAKIIAASFTNSLYFNWDIPEHRTGPASFGIIVFSKASSARTPPHP
jgi:predicted AAA+ superfamily ATPase